MKKHLIPAIFFSVFAITFGVAFAIQGLPLWAPIMTGISGIIFWILYFDDLKNIRKISQENDT